MLVESGEGLSLPSLPTSLPPHCGVLTLDLPSPSMPRYEANPRASLQKFQQRMWRYGYLCYIFTPNNFVPITGADRHCARL